MSDVYRRILELERRSLRLARSQDFVKRQQQALSQAINHPGGISGWPVFSSGGSATIYPTVQTLNVNLQSIRVHGYPTGLDPWTTLSSWSTNTIFHGLHYDGTDEPWPIPIDQYSAIFRSSYSGPSYNFFNTPATLTLQGITNNLTANYSGLLIITDQSSGFQESYRITADITYNGLADTSMATLRIVSLTGFQMPNLNWYYPINFNASTIETTDKIAALGTSGSITANRNGRAYLTYKDYDGSTPPKFIVQSIYARNPVLGMQW